MSIFRNSDGIPRIWPAIAFLLAALAIAIWAAWYARETLETVTALTEQRKQASTARLHLEQTLSLFKDLETGVRGFVITGQESYLAPYRQAAAALPALQAELKQLLASHDPSGADRALLDQLMRQRLQLLEQTITGRRDHGDEIIHDQALLDAGKEAMDRLREHFRRIDGRLAEHIAAIGNAVAEARRQAARWAAITTGLGLCLVLLAIFLLLREHALRRALEGHLRRSNAELDARVGERTEALARARDRIAAFAREQDRAIEAERRRLSREVHDQIGQVFTAIKLIVGSLPRDAFPTGQEDALREALETGIASTRRITAELRPPLLDDLGLAAALEHFAGTLAAPGGVHCEIAIADAGRLDAEQALTLFRIVQEALTNTVRHAGADRLRIAGRAAGNDYRLSIADNGRGLAGKDCRPGALGLAGMRERALLLGGECRIGDGAPGGTVVEVTLPLSPPEDSHEHPAR